jgi:HK97 family phage major capsid protein
LGAGTIPIPVADLILDLTALTGVAEQSLGVVTMPGGVTKLPKKTANPVALCYTQADQPETVPVDNTLTGANLTESAVTIAVLLQISEELISDASVDATAAFLLAAAQAIAFRFDYCSFAANGVDDVNNGGMTGLFNSAGVLNYSAIIGNTTLGGLQRSDFLETVSTLNPVAIQRGVSSWMHPSFIPVLMSIHDNGTGKYAIQTPMENDGEQWSLAGFPLHLTTTAPVATAPGSPGVLFGYGAAYQVGLRQDLEIRESVGVYFDKHARGVFVSRRGRCDLQDATQFAILKLAAQ